MFLGGPAPQAPAGTLWPLCWDVAGLCPTIDCTGEDVGAGENLLGPTCDAEVLTPCEELALINVLR